MGVTALPTVSAGGVGLNSYGAAVGNVYGGSGNPVTGEVVAFSTESRRLLR